MKLVIFGAGGKTGTLVTQQALDAGYEVVAYVRRPDSVTLEHENLKVVVGELSDRAKIKAVVAGADACVSTLGGKSLTKRATEFTQGIRHIVDAMEAEEVKRFAQPSVGNTVKQIHREVAAFSERNRSAEQYDPHKEIYCQFLGSRK